MSELASLLPYPPIPGADDVPELMGKMVYIIHNYRLDGLSALIQRSHQDVIYTFGDFDGNEYHLDVDGSHMVLCKRFITEMAVHITNVMVTIGVPKAVFYISVDGDDMKLVDMRLSLDKLVSPGMLRDMFEKRIRTQQIYRVCGFTKELLDELRSDNRDFIVKSSSFKTIARDKSLLPLYARIRNNKTDFSTKTSTKRATSDTGSAA